MLATNARKHLSKIFATQLWSGFSRRSFTSAADFDERTDVLIVGSGGAALTAALKAHENGLKPLIVEKGDRVGGTTAVSGGGLWIPNNHLNREAVAAGTPGCFEDSFKAALTYMEDVIKEGAPVSSRERKTAFLENGPKMVEFLEKLGFKWVVSRGYPDYHPERPGGRAGGRQIEGQPFDLNLLGDWSKKIVTRAYPQPPTTTYEGPLIARSFTSAAAFAALAKLLVSRQISALLKGQKLETQGASLVGQLLYLNLQRQTPIWSNSPFRELIVKDGKVVGAVVDKQGQGPIRIGANKAVLLAAGGFAKNAAMRAKYQQAPASTEWTSVRTEDTGDAITAGLEIGAAVDLMDDSWWGPSTKDPANGFPLFSLWERSYPHSIIVDSSGKRFMNEGQSYVDAGHDQYKRHEQVSAIPAWLVIDHQHRSKYLLGMHPGRITPKKAFDSGFLVKADTVRELAQKINVDPDGLASTVEKFNEMAKKGVDEEFGRGQTAYEWFNGDPNHTHPNLGTLEKPPFYACKMWPGDLGTKGGLLTDQFARVLRQDGSVIEGLYATGNTTASVMGRRYPGPGSTLGPALTFAYVAMEHVAGKLRK